MNKSTKSLDFSGITFYCGLDVHKKNWRVNIRDAEFELEDYSSDPDAVALFKHLTTYYPHAKFKVAYEAGFSGFSAQRTLASLGVECLVVNAADIPVSDKEKRRKQDKVDARKLSRHLTDNKMEGIYIPDPSWEHARTLVRTRSQLVNNQTRCKNRIWHLLHFSGLPQDQIKDTKQYWSRRFISVLQEMDCFGSEQLKASLSLQIKSYLTNRTVLLEATHAIRKMCGDPLFRDSIKLLRTIPSIGEINAAVILLELQDIKRFKVLDELCSYAGLVPDSNQSGDTTHKMKITKRTNQNLRTALVESSWMVIRKDPALLIKYKHYCQRMEKNQAIIRIARHLLARIRFVLTNQKPYQMGLAH